MQLIEYSVSAINPNSKAVRFIIHAKFEVEGLLYRLSFSPVQGEDLDFRFYLQLQHPEVKQKSLCAFCHQPITHYYFCPIFEDDKEKSYEIALQVVNELHKKQRLRFLLNFKSYPFNLVHTIERLSAPNNKTKNAQ